jgi:nitrate/TMAO reductase-like tetraheme cytochrome c subunit
VKDAQASRDRLVRVAAIVAAVIVVVIGLIAGSNYLTSSPKVCASCHEMVPSVATWTTSAHAPVGCWTCHQESRPWYQYPQTLAERVSRLNRDWQVHRSNDASGIAESLLGMKPNVPDDRCLACHDLSRSITLRFGTLIQHEKHAERNRSCISCHFDTAHPAPGIERPILLMQRCFDCHGRTPGAKAPGRCSECHPKTFSLRPESHRAATWQRQHGKASLSHTQPCAMCHETTFCTNCHGTEMPHPDTWVRGNPGHATIGAANRQMCAKCHTDKPDLCSMCHHKGLASAQGSWLKQHPSMVEKKGTSFCMDCHVPVFCYNCHTSRNTGGPTSNL